MRVLVTWGSRLGGTAGIAAIIAEQLRARGVDVVAVPAAEAPSPIVFDAAIIGGALYANRWHADARRYVERHARELARVPTWLFSSGPLDATADAGTLPPPRRLRALGERIGSLGHMTFGGRLERDVKNVVAAAMAKKLAGDWRKPEHIRAWADQIADALPTARPRPAVELPGGSLLRLVEYGAVGWVVPATLLVALATVAPLWIAVTIHAIAMPTWFGWLSARYQKADGARSPALVALSWTVLTAVLYLGLVVRAVDGYLLLGSSITGMWLPLALTGSAIWAAGAIAAMLPLPRPHVAS